MSTMTSKEKFENCLNIGPVKDRSEIPIFPHLLSYPAAFAGMTQKEMMDSPKAWMKALSYFYENIGKPDVSLATYPGDVVFLMGLESKRPGYELDDNAQYQFIETPKMDIDDYKDIVKNGWNQWYNGHLGRIQNPPKGNFGITMRWIKVGMNGGKVGKFFAQNGVEALSQTAMAPVFDTLSMLRSFEEFIYDLMDEPELIHDVLRKGTPEVIETTLTNVKRAKGNRAGMFAMRSDANAISPDIFEEFAWPYLSQTVREFHKAGVTTIIHADGNWLPMLEKFLELPKASVMFEFDGETDMFKAYDIIGGHHSMRGDVGASMFAFGTPDDIREYCEKLITGLGMKGGFMLASGCEIPINAKAENIKAMFESLRA